MGRSYQLAALVAGIIVAIGAAMVWEAVRPATRSPQIKNLGNAKQLATGCQLYAADHAGRFPIHLTELEPNYILGVAAMQCAIVRGGKDSGERVDWLYFGAGFGDKNPPNLLIASPQAVKAQRVFITGDTAGQVGKEDQYQMLLVETVKEMRSLAEARRAETPTAAPPKPPEN